MSRRLRTRSGQGLVLNPGLELRVSVQTRRPGLPNTWWEGNAEGLPLLRSLIDAMLAEKEDRDEFEMSPELLEVARGLGWLVQPDQVPGSEIDYRCDLDESVLALAAPIELSPIVPERLIVNPQHVLQPGATVPERVAERLQIQPGAPATFGGLARDYPIAWFEDPGSRFLWPFWLNGDWGSEFEAAIRGRARPDQLSEEAVRAMRIARVLLAEGELESSREAWAARLAHHREELAAQKYVVLRQILNPAQVGGMRLFYRRLREHGYFRVDREQAIEMRSGVYSDVATRHVHGQLNWLVVQLTGEWVKPSFTWAYRYHPHATLERHVDRPQCRWNISICIDNEPEVEREASWPLNFQVGDEVHAVSLGIGDCVLYRGDELPHWRDALPAGHFYNACFLHYVTWDFTGSLD